jgi:hypothetical protein
MIHTMCSGFPRYIGPDRQMTEELFDIIEARNKVKDEMRDEV